MFHFSTAVLLISKAYVDQHFDSAVQSSRSALTIVSLDFQGRAWLLMWCYYGFVFMGLCIVLRGGNVCCASVEYLERCAALILPSLWAGCSALPMEGCMADLQRVSACNKYLLNQPYIMNAFIVLIWDLWLRVALCGFRNLDNVHWLVVQLSA